jgi:hypothetical protein
MGIMKSKLVEFSHTEFKQDMWNGLWDNRKVNLDSYLNRLYYWSLWVNIEMPNRFGGSLDFRFQYKLSNSLWDT